MRVVLTNANVIDCVHPRPLVGASVTVEHGRIVEVLESRRAPDLRDAQVVDLHGALPAAPSATRRDRCLAKLFS
jgi:adenine deaminase